MDLKGKNIGDTHANEIAKCLKANPLVRVLDLSSNKITDDGCQGIAKAICGTEIQTLSFANNKITEKCCEPLAGVLKTNKNLKHLDLSGNNISNRVMQNKIKNSLTQTTLKF